MESKKNSVDASQLLEIIKQDAIEYCAVKGVLMKSNTPQQDVEYSHLPISLFPTPYPIEHYQQALKLQPCLATMVGSLVKQPNKIHEVLKFF